MIEAKPEILGLKGCLVFAFGLNNYMMIHIDNEQYLQPTNMYYNIVWVKKKITKMSLHTMQENVCQLSLWQMNQYYLLHVQGFSNMNATSFWEVLLSKNW